MLKGAVVGFSAEAEKYFLPAFSTKAGAFKITAAADIPAARKQRAAAKIYSSPEDLFSEQSGRDFAVICLPPLLRSAMAQRALDNRLHVFRSAVPNHEGA